MNLEPTTRVQSLFREWWKVEVEWKPGDGDWDAFVAQGDRLAREIFAEPTITAQDLAMKLVVHIGNGSYSFEGGLDHDFVDRQIRPLLGQNT